MTTYKDLTNIQHVTRILEIIGLVLSTVGVLLQVIWFAIDKKIRSKDQKILLQLSMASLFLTCLNELRNLIYLNYIYWIVRVAVNLEIRLVILTWLYIFTYNLYDKVVNDTVRENNLVKQSILVWIVPIPFAVIFSVLTLFLFMNSELDVDMSYYLIKAVALFINICLLIFTFTKAIILNGTPENFKIVTVSVTALIILLVVDLIETVYIAFDLKESVQSTLFNMAFTVTETYYAIVTTVIFVIVSRNIK